MELVARGEEKPSKVKRTVVKSMRDLQKIEYCFEQ